MEQRNCGFGIADCGFIKQKQAGGSQQPRDKARDRQAEKNEAYCFVLLSL